MAGRVGTLPGVSVVVLNRNGKRYLEECLTSLQSQTYPNLELILVDDASTDGSVELVRQRFPGVRIIQLATNLGFAANNQGMRSARGEYVALINNDTRADNNWILEMVQAAEADHTVGMCAPKILSIHNPRIIDSVGGLLIYPDGMSRGRGRLQVDRGQFDAPGEALLPSGCAGLYRKTMLGEVGGFDGDFFAYCEDTDLGLRCRLAGWKARSVPSAVVHHHYSGYWQGYSPRKAFLVERNRIWVLAKNFPGRLVWKALPHTARRYGIQAFGALSGHGSAGRFQGSRPQLVWTLLRAHAAAYRGLPRMLTKRRQVQALRRVSETEMERWLTEFRIGAVELGLRD